MSVIRIIFVGQEDVSDDLKLSFETDKKDWSIFFAATGADALAELASHEYDVVITEMQLPDTTATELLRQVQDQFPVAARLVLSATGDQQMVIRSLGVAHQILSKPCKLDVLKRQIANSLAMRAILNNDSLHARIAKIDKLPVLPSVYSQLIQEMQSDNASIHKIAALVRQDVSITARVLQMINSAHFGVSRHVEGVLQAVNLLGLDIVKSLVLAAGVFSQFKESGLQGFLLDEICKHSMTVGTSAHHFANAFGLSHGQADEALTAGTLHDIGKLILVTNFEQEAQQIAKLAQEKELPLHEAERQILGVSHCEIGAHLLSLWGLSDQVLEAVAFHDAPQSSASPTLNVLAAVHLANALEHDEHIPNRDPRFTTANIDYLNQVGIGSQLTHLRTLVATQ